MEIRKDIELLRCATCDKPLDTDDEIEFSEHYCEYFCCPDCAMDFYFRAARSAPVDDSHWADENFEINRKLIYKRL